MSKLNAKILKNKINYSALILVLIVGLLSFAQKVNSENTACTAPRGEILHITENTNITLCPSTYNTKIIIEGDNIILDCNNAEIVGNYEGAAIQINSGYEQEDILSELENVDLHSVSIEEMYELFNNKQKYENITIKNCIIKNFENGIKGGIIKNLVLENNKITEQQETAVAAIDSIIRNNKIENSYKGFNILGLSNQVINNSVKDIEDVCIGLGGFNNTIEQNKVEKCKYGIVIIGVQNSLKENKAEKNSIGVALWGGGKTEVDRNIANDNQIAGIGIFDSSYNIIENNIANNNRIGIILAGLFSTEPGKNNTIIHNEARNNSEGGIILSDWNFAKLIAGVIPNAGAQNLAEITGTVIYANEMDNNYNIIIEDEKAKNIHNNIIKENNFYNGGVKISEENTKNNIIENNNVIKEKIYLAKISDKILGNVEDIKTGIRDINIEITGIKEGEQISGLHEVKIKDGDRTLVKFDFNFTDNILNLSNIIIEKQKEGDIKGYTYISGVGGVTKTLYLDKINPYLKYVCIKDEEIESISEISNNCHGNNEYLLKCDGLERYGYKCVEEAENYIITGLKHSGVTQSPLSGHFITFQIISQENNNFTFSQNLTILPTHTGIEDNCSEINCDRIFEDYDQYNITLTDGVTPLGTLVLNGVLTATTLSDKTTYAGTSFLWGNATITQTSPQFPYDGEYVVVMESWNNKLGALAIINQTGTQINAIQFIINTSRIMDNEIMIVGTNTIPLDLVEDDKEYAINTDKGIVIIKDAYEAIRYDITNEHEGVYNRTTTIGIINITNQTHNILINGWGKGWYDNLTKEYNKIFYGYILDEEEIVISECNTDNDCDDNDSNTLDKCIVPIEYEILNKTKKECSHFPYNIYGQITDTITGNPVPNVNISFYPVEVFKPYEITDWTIYIEQGIIQNSTGDYTILQPKNPPDTTTDENGNYKYYLPPGRYNIVIQGSSKKKFDTQAQNNTGQKIILPETGNIVVTFEKASAYLKSDLYFKNVSGANNSVLISRQTTVGVSKDLGIFNAGDELEFYITVNGTTWSPPLGYYNHTSTSQYAIIERLDYDTWRIYFEDLPDTIADWDYNDAVVLVDLTYEENTTTYNYTDDCDGDGIKNWEDNDDELCDKGTKDTDVFENETYDPYTSFNVEGHIIHSGDSENDNKYSCGQKVEFVMFGQNFGNQNVTVTFAIENHTATGKPTHMRDACTNYSGIRYANVGGEDKIIYCGNISYSEENLFIPVGAQGQNKVEKKYVFVVPCEFAPEEGKITKYDIHVYDNEKWGNMHKIGNFFVIGYNRTKLNETANNITTNETTHIEIEGLGEMELKAPDFILTYTDKPTTSWYHVKKHPCTKGTICEKFNYAWTFLFDDYGPDPEFNVTVVDDETGKIFLTDGNGSRYQPYTTNIQYFTVNYTENGYKNATLIAIHEPTGLTIKKRIIVKVAINEEEANQLAEPIYREYFGGWLPSDWGDPWRNVTAQVNPAVINEWDRYDAYNNQIGDEYCSATDCSITDQFDIDGLESNLQPPLCITHPPYGKYIPPSTAEEFIEILDNYLYTIKCTCANSILVGGRPCS